MNINLLNLSIFRITLLLVIIVGVKVDADPAGNEPQVIHAPLIPQPPKLLQTATNLQPVNFDGSGNMTNTAASNAYEVMLLKQIDDTEHELQKPDLNTNYRHTLQWILSRNQGELSNHLAQVQQNLEFIKSARANPRTAWTNMPDPIEQALASDVSIYERELANPTLAANTRKTDEAMLEDYKQKLADHITNAQLWANLHMDQQDNNSEQIIRSQNQLADYLAKKLGQMQGKTYPQGMSLDAVIAEYQKQVGGSHWFDNRTIIRTIMFSIFILPPIIMLFIAIIKRFSK